MDKITETAETIYDYVKNGDQSTPKAEIIEWICYMICEITSGKFTKDDLFQAFMRRTPTSIIAEGMVESMENQKRFDEWHELYTKEQKGK